MQTGLRTLQVKVTRVKIPRMQAAGRRMAGVGRVLHGSDKIRKTGNAATVFGRAGVAAAQALWLATVCRGHRFQLDAVQPAIPKVVQVANGQCLALQQLPQGVAARVHGRVFGLIGVGLPIALTGNFKLIQMAVLPAHDGLNRTVQFRQCHSIRYQQTPPDCGLDIAQLNVQLVTVTGFVHGCLLPKASQIAADTAVCCHL